RDLTSALRDKDDAQASCGRSAAKELQRCCLVQCNVIRLVALDLVLRVILVCMVDVSFIIDVLRVPFHNPATDVPRLGIPGYVIAEFEFVRHERPRNRAPPRVASSTTSRAEQ